MSTLGAILRQLCPRCRIGHIFQKSIWRGFARMNDRCVICGLKFEREQGYFLGAMYISYGIGVILICLFSFVVWTITHAQLTRDVLWGILLFVPFVPVVTLLSRVLWIYLDRAADPEHQP